MLGIALEVKPDIVTLVPEKREERTTEGGLSPAAPGLAEAIAQLTGAGIDVSLFIDPDDETVRRSGALGASTVELHTGDYCEARGDEQVQAELVRLRRSAELAASLGLKVAAGHGLDYPNVAPVAALEPVEELNIGHAIIARAVFVGLDRAVRDMLAATAG
jgi:pyridoxine 5-phosphate synthase